jgi:membrane associated rhomboid family serine protease
MPVVPSIAAPGSNEPLQLDVCVSCQFVWFDPTEHEAWLRASSLAATDGRLPAETRAALARLPQPPPPAPTAEPDESPPFARLTPEGEFEWKYLICLLGLPVEIDPPPLQRRPWVTWTVAALVAMVSMAAGPQAQAALAWAFVPAEMWRYGGATLVTSFFLHGSLWHLVGNMYFLVALGDNVEDLVGGVRYLGLLLAGTMAGNLLHAALDPSSRVPAIGASGGIAAVILYYGLLFPHGRLRLFKFMLLVDLSVWAALVLWVVVQLVGTFVQASYPTEVSYAAHLGGALAGLIFWSVSGRGEIARVLDVRG